MQSEKRRKRELNYHHSTNETPLATKEYERQISKIYYKISVKSFEIPIVKYYYYDCERKYFENFVKTFLKNQNLKLKKVVNIYKISWISGLTRFPLILIFPNAKVKCFSVLVEFDVV